MSHILPATLTEEPLRATGIHIGVKGAITKDMKQFVTSIAPSGNPIMDVNAIIRRLDSAGKFIAGDNMKPVVYATDNRFENALKTFHATTLIPTVFHRFMPGCLTNPQSTDFIDATMLIVSDPTNGVPTKIGQALTGDRRAMHEASSMGIPVVAICNTNATFEDVDFCIPANNTSPKAIATTFYLLARSILIASGWFKFTGLDLCLYDTKEPVSIEDFETKIVEKEESEDE